MENKETKMAETQGAQTKKQKPSASYTLTQMLSVIEKLRELDLITAEEARQVAVIRMNAKNKWIESI